MIEFLLLALGAYITFSKVLTYDLEHRPLTLQYYSLELKNLKTGEQTYKVICQKITKIGADPVLLTTCSTKEDAATLAKIAAEYKITNYNDFHRLMNALGWN